MAELSWLTGADRFVLRFLAGHETPNFRASPSVVAANVGYSAPHVRTRLGVLLATGLVRRLDDDRGYYAISDLGERYLERDVTRTELRRLEGRGRRAVGEEPAHPADGPPSGRPRRRSGLTRR